jgi:hypothetical protein
MAFLQSTPTGLELGAQAHETAGVLMGLLGRRPLQLAAGEQTLPGKPRPAWNNNRICPTAAVTVAAAELFPRLLKK